MPDAVEGFIPRRETLELYARPFSQKITFDGGSSLICFRIFTAAANEKKNANDICLLVFERRSNSSTKLTSPESRTNDTKSDRSIITTVPRSKMLM